MGWEGEGGWREWVRAGRWASCLEALLKRVQLGEEAIQGRMHCLRTSGRQQVSSSQSSYGRRRWAYGNMGGELACAGFGPSILVCTLIWIAGSSG